jgi:uncharacterized membrane protein YhiD involved in acid resistance
MDALSAASEFIVQSKTQIPIFGFIINLVLTGAHALAIKWVYVRYGNSLSNRSSFGKNFILLAVTTMIIITIVKSSLALSLGLVGALSIIRFRSAIKEPEELAYLFLAISVGLGFGANQGVITTIGIVIILAMIVMGKKYMADQNENKNMHVSISSKSPELINIDSMVKKLSKHCAKVDLRRYDENVDSLELLFVVEFDSYEKLMNIKNDMSELDPNVKITYLDMNPVT